MRQLCVGLCLCALSVFGQLQSPTLVTRANQVSLGLDFKIDAKKMGERVYVRFEFKKAGKLDGIASASLLVRDSREIRLMVPMAMLEQPDGTLINFVISPQLAKDAYIELTGLIEEAGASKLEASSKSFSIRLKDYIAE